MALGLALNVAAAAAADIKVDDPYAHATMRAVKTGAVFMTLHNTGEAADALIAAETPAARKAELHTHDKQDGVMLMRPLDRMEVAPGTPTVLAPGGLHVMLIDLKDPLKAGSSFPLTLEFRQAGAVTVDVQVRQRNGGMGHHGDE